MLRTSMEREFVGLKTDLSVDFDQRTIGVIRQIDSLVEVTVRKRLELMKPEILRAFKVENI